jgi:hypothetical protein
MIEEQKTYLELLEAAIWGKELTNERLKELTTERVNDVIRLAAFQGTGPLVFDQLLKLRGLSIPEALRMQMKQQCMMSIMQQNSMIPLLTQAWKALEEEKIHPVLLKGFGLAQYYPQPYLRQWGDIDIYVGQSNYHTACGKLRETFPNAMHSDKEDEDYKHYNFDFDNTAIETHRVSMVFAHPIDRKFYAKLEEQCLIKDGPKKDFFGVEVTIPEDTFNVFFVFLHAWHHFETTGMNVKQLCDLAVLLQAKHNVIDTNRLRRILTQLHLLEVWQLIMYILVKYLDLPQDKTPFYTIDCSRRAELFFERVLTEGNNRAHSKINADGVCYLQRKWLTFQSRIADSQIVKTYAPKYARHKFIGDLLHGIERIMANK